jgi:hypothetical protein
MKGLRKARVIGQGHGGAGTVQERIMVKRGGVEINKVRVWSLDAKKFARFVKATPD